MYTTTPERLLGTQFLGAIACVLVWLWLGALMGAAPVLLFLGLFGAAVLGWVMPMFIVDHRARTAAIRSSAGCPT